MRSNAAIDLAPAAAQSPACRMCGGESRPWIDVPGDWRAEPRDDARARPVDERVGPYRLLRCEACDVGFLDPMPSVDEVRRWYAEGSSPRRSAFPVPPRGRPRMIDRALSALARRADRSADVDASWMRRRFGRERLSVCDLGCGDGALLRRIAPLGHDVMGLELDPEAAAIARRAGLEVFEGSIEDPPSRLTDRRFELVFLMHVLEHCADPDRALARARSLLAPGGALVVEVPNAEARGLAAAGAAWNFLEVPRHLHFFTTRSLRRAVERAELAVVDVEYVGYVRQFSPAWIAREQVIWDRLRTIAGRDAALPPRSSTRRARALLGRTLLDQPSRTHDSVRVICQRGAAL